MIKIDHKIRNKWHSGYTRFLKPNEIVIHGTAGGKTYDWVLGGSRAHEYVRGIALFHYLIELDGTTIEIIDPDRWVYHSSSGRHDKRTIGIEMINGHYKNEYDFRDAQYKALFDLILLLYRRYSIKFITSHERNANKYSNIHLTHCPGNFDWNKLEKWLADYFLFEHKENQLYFLRGLSVQES